MRRAAGALCLTLAVAAGPGAAAATAPDATTVSTGYSLYEPERVAVLTGETVTWKNDSVRNHTVTSDDETFDSGRIVAGQTFSRRFDAAGTYTYHCTLHAGMRGEVDVADVLLDPPSGPAGPGRPFPLSGRAAGAPGSEVAIEADTGGGFQRVGSASLGDDGSFTAVVAGAGHPPRRALPRALRRAPGPSRPRARGADAQGRRDAARGQPRLPRRPLALKARPLGARCFTGGMELA